MEMVYLHLLQHPLPGCLAETTAALCQYLAQQAAWHLTGAQTGQAYSLAPWEEKAEEAQWTSLLLSSSV